ncbi:MAG TPA: replication-associated recombination protein A [Myxococcaceae bacterium]|jgi:putative ATPase|nr:replication-associated recombination protein A [Myxococcaceae bacterium]
MDLFAQAAEREAASRAPLADRMRPTSLAELLGQEHLTGPGRLLRRAVEGGALPSLILWGPPGTGKTTLARLLAGASQAAFVQMSAVLAGVKDIREAVAQAQERARLHGQRTVLFLDEIHRFNKAQQDALLPHVEKGTVTLLGATTENPSFEVNSALLSRTRVVTLRPLEEDELLELLRRALVAPQGLAGKVEADEEALRFIARTAGGDARRALTALETAASGGGRVTVAVAAEALQRKVLLYDRAGDEHYAVISAFIKSMRGSDPDAALYWMTRMLEAGEDPRFVLRRMVIFASEDVGNADPQALVVAVAALQAYELMGLPEGTLPMTQAVAYLALAPKSNAVITAYGKAKETVQETGTLPVPPHLRPASTPLMKKLGFGSAYQYPHDFEGHWVRQQYLPDELQGRRFYEPSESGAEAGLKRRLEELRAREAEDDEPGSDG